MPPGIAVATVGINGAMNAAVLATQILALSDPQIAERFEGYRCGLVDKIVKANTQLASLKYKYKVN